METTQAGDSDGGPGDVAWVGTFARDRVRAQLFGPDVAPPPALGRYTLRGRLGRGGMGTVLLAHDPMLGRDVAVKLVDAPEPKLRARVIHEAQANARVRDPHVVEVYDVGTANESVYIVMELVRGDTLRAWCRASPRRWREVVAQFLAAGHGLEAVHRAGLVHRDFKPENVVVGEDGRVRLLDFGIARALADTTPLATPLPPDSSVIADLATLATAGDHAGTPAYMAPEQLTGGVIDGRADQFAFCVALWEALFGERPGGNVAVAAMVDGRWPPARPRTNPTVPRAVVAALQRGLAMEPARRFGALEELLARLQRAAGIRRTNRIVTAVALASAGALVWLAVRRPEPCAEVAAPGAALWSASRRAAAQQAVLDVQGELAPAAWARIDPAIAEFATRWQAERTRVCEADGPRREASEHCLDRILADADAVAQGLDRLDAPTLVARLDEAQRLPAPTRCSDPEVLAAMGASAGDVDPQARARLAEVEASQNRGEFATALAQAEALAADATVAHTPWLDRRVALLAARARAELGSYAEADAAFTAIYDEADAANDPELKARAAVAAASLATQQRRDREAARTWSQRALAAARVSLDPGLLDEAEHALAMAALVSGAGDEAVPLFEGVAARLRQRCPWPCGQLVDIEIKLSMGEGVLGHNESALAHARESVALADAALGGQHPSTAAAYNQLCAQLDTMQRSAEALPYCQRAYEIIVAAFGPNHAEAGAALGMLATLESAVGDPERARARLREAEAILLRTLGPGHPDALAATTNLAVIDLNRQVYADAELLLRDVIARNAAAGHPLDPFDETTLHHNLGLVLMELGRDDESLTYLRDAEQRRVALGVPSEVLSITRTAIGVVLTRQGDREAAASVLETALAAEGDDDDYNRATRRLYLGEALAESDPARALRLVDDAIALYMRHSPNADALDDARALRQRLADRVAAVP
ncbi:MAG: serine/threonine-protein kinase [Nannocystaceae bacterium]|nr:serine/threonine-protein kinase [Nannocystaceae bacterium]